MTEEKDESGEKTDNLIRKARSLAELLRLLGDSWYEFVEGEYHHVPTWGPETPAVAAQISPSCADGDIVSWDTRASDMRKHRYLRRDWNLAHEEGRPEQLFYIVTHAEAEAEWEHVPWERPSENAPRPAKDKSDP
jgi:hypothetical protein